MNIVAVSYIHVSILSFKIDLEEQYQDENVSRLGYGTVNDLNFGYIKKKMHLKLLMMSTNPISD